MADLLFLAHRIPYPPDKGDKLRSFHMLDYLRRHYRVHLGCFVDDEQDWRHVGKLKAMCHETCFVPLTPALATLRSLRGMWRGEALSLPYYRDRRMTVWVESLLRRLPVRTALAFSSPMAQYLAQAHDLHRLVDFVDVDSEKWRAYGATRPWPLSTLFQREAERLLDYERAIALRCDSAAFVSAAEAALFARLAPECTGKLMHFNNGVDADYFSPNIVFANPYADGDQVLVFTGAMDYWPNAEAACWFAHKVFARVRQRWPAARFYVVGRHPRQSVRALAKLPGVVVTGGVADVRPYLAHARAAVAPLRIARGIQNKVLEAMAMQKIVIASPQALEGISASPGEDILVAGCAEQFCTRINNLLAGHAGTGMALAARARMLRDYSWQNNLARLGQALAPVPTTARRA